MKKTCLLVMPLMALSFLASCNNKPVIKKWNEQANWWEYCSNGKEGEQATAEDIGVEVTLTLYGKVHKVRLIDVDHKNEADGAPEAHCTFEFANVITNSDGKVVTTKWNLKEPETNDPDNYNFPDSTLNDLLNDVNQKNCIFNQLPDGLKADGVIKEVSKKVGRNSSYSTDTPYQTKLFPLAHDEMTDNADGSVVEGLKYKYYVDHSEQKDRIKKVAGASEEDSGKWYWMRSPVTKSKGCAWLATGSGSLAQNFPVNTETSVGIAPAFCI